MDRFHIHGTSNNNTTNTTNTTNTNNNTAMIEIPKILARAMTLTALLVRIFPHSIPLISVIIDRISDELDSKVSRIRIRGRRKSSLKTENKVNSMDDDETNNDCDDLEDDLDENDDDYLVMNSALSIAALRACEQKRGRSAICSDEFARKLAGRKAYEKALKKLPIGDNGRIAIRTKFFDDTILIAMYENPALTNWQVVLLGAGLDTRAFRLPNPHELIDCVFEIDHRQVLRRKRKLLQSSWKGFPKVTLARERKEIECDLQKEDWLKKLKDEGFDQRKPTIWMLEGLLYYLTPEFASAIVRECADASCAGSYIVASAVNSTSLYRAISTAHSHYQDLENQQTPMQNRLTYSANDDDYYSPSLYSSSSSSYNNNNNNNNNNNRKVVKKTSARQTWKSAIDCPEVYMPARGWKKVKAYQLGEEGCDFGRWTGKAPTERAPQWKTDLEPRSFYIRAAKEGYLNSSSAFSSVNYRNKVEQFDYHRPSTASSSYSAVESSTSYRNKILDAVDQGGETSFSYLDEDDAGFISTPSVEIMPARHTYSKSDIDRILRADDEIDEEEAMIRRAGQIATMEFEFRLNDVITEFDE